VGSKKEEGRKRIEKTMTKNGGMGVTEKSGRDLEVKKLTYLNNRSRLC